MTFVVVGAGATGVGLVLADLPPGSATDHRAVRKKLPRVERR